MSETKLLKIFFQSRKDQIKSQLDRLSFLKSRNVIKYHETVQMENLNRELAEIEYSEKNK